MTNDLFTLLSVLEPIPMVGAEVSYMRELPLGRSPIELAQELMTSTPWRAEQIVVWGKSYPQPRLIAWYGDETKNYSYSGIALQPLPWTATLIDVKSRVEDATGAVFNSVLLNYYRNNQDSMGFHSDDEPELGEQPIIASLSLGAARTFVLKHKSSKHEKAVRLKLPSGSLLLMRGDTQRNWKHGIGKESAACGPRVNLTFRRIFT